MSVVKKFKELLDLDEIDVLINEVESLDTLYYLIFQIQFLKEKALF